MRAAADFVEVTPADHGRIETRRIWGSTALTASLAGPQVRQVVLSKRESIKPHTGAHADALAWGLTSRTPHQAAPRRGLAVNRGHWSIERVHHLLD